MKEEIMKLKSLGSMVLYTGAIGISILLLFFVITGTWIGYEAKRQCSDAIHEYGGDCVEALILQLNDEHRGYRARNDAVWTLGQMGDGRALPILESYYSGNIPAREPLDKSISQYELKKAIRLVRGGVNITAFIWR